MNTRVSSAVETSVYVLATVMTPRYSRSILSVPSIKANRPTLRTVRDTPVWGTVNLIPTFTIDASGISGTDPIAFATLMRLARDLALLEVGQEDAVGAPRQQPLALSRSARANASACSLVTNATA
jgi:hypothetical protein